MTKRSVPPTASGRGSPPGPASPPGPGADAAEPPEAASQRTFRPGPGLVVVLAGTGMVVVLALGAAVSNALGAHGVAALLGGASLVVVGLALLAVLRVPARSLVVNAPCLRLARVRSRAARRDRLRQDDPARTRRRWRRGRQEADGSPQAASRARGHHEGRAAGHTAGQLVLRTVAGELTLPEADPDRRELTTLDVVSGPVTTLVAASAPGRWADEHLAGTTTGESLARLVQLLAGTLGFVLLALGLASVLGQVLS